MELCDFSKGMIWGILPEHLDTMARLIQDFRSPEDLKAKLQSIEAKLPQVRGKGGDLYDAVDGTALIPISGPISKTTTLWTLIFGGTGMDYVSEAYRSALADDAIWSIALLIDSPGGTLGGLEAFSEMAYRSRGEKPVIAFSDGMMASAAYWIGSAADELIVDPTAQVGSIGVLSVHYDFSESDRQAGLKRTVLFSGAQKAFGNNAEPLSPEARQVFQSQLDTIYGLFIDTVARNRGVGADKVRADMADGRIFIGRQAVEAGLADKIGTLETALARASELAEGRTDNKYWAGLASAGGQNMNTKTEGTPMTIEKIRAEHPELAAALEAAGAKTVDVEKIRVDEQKRLISLVDAVFGAEAHEHLSEIVAMNLTAGQYKAATKKNPDKWILVRQSAAETEEQRMKNEMLAAAHAAGAPNVGAGGVETGGGRDFMAQVETYRLQYKCGKIDAMQAVMRADPKSHAEFLKKANG